MPVTATLPEAAALAISDGGDVFDITAQLARDGNPWPFIEWQWGQVLFAEDVMDDPELPERLKASGEWFLIIDRFQFELISAVFDTTVREIYVKGNTGCGKGASSAIAICVYYAIYHDARVVITRDSNDTAVRICYGEVQAWWKRMADPPPNIEVQAEGLIDLVSREEHILFVANPRSGEGFSGVHGPHILFWFDEATAEVLGPRFHLADTQAHKFLATANPRSVGGPFFRAFQLASDPDKTQTVIGPYGPRRLITADGEDMLNVRLQRLEHAVSPYGGITIEGKFYEAGEPIPPDVFERVKRIVPGQTGYDVHQGHKQNPDPNWVLCFAHGKFPPEDAELQVILRSWLAQPVEEWKEWRAIVQRAEKHQGAALKLAREYCPIQALGLDVGASRKGDPSILTLGGERGIACQLEYKTADAGDLVAWIFRMAERYDVNLTGGGIPVGIDAVGVGWGVSPMLRERGVLVVEIKGNDTSDDPKRYVNKRAEMYGEFGARLNPDGEYADQPFLLPDDEMLLAELVAPQKIFTASGEGMAYKITPKRKVLGLALKVETIEEKLGRSPDRGDSACYWWRAMQVRGVDLSEWLDAGAF